MDLFQALAAIAAVNGVEKDTRDPFALMPKSIQSITLTHRKKKVNIPRTVENLFNYPSFICSDIEKFWRNVKKDPKGYVIDSAKEFRTKIVYQ